MFNNLKVKIMRAVYNYHHNKAEYFWEKLVECETQGEERDALDKQYRYHADEELRLVEEIYLLGGIC